MLEASLVLGLFFGLTLLFDRQQVSWDMIEMREQMILGHVFKAIFLSDSIAHQKALLSCVSQTFTFDFSAFQHTNQLSHFLTALQHQQELFTANILFFTSQFKPSSFPLIFSNFIGSQQNHKMQARATPSLKLNLTNQIEVYKNYNEHRKRLQLTRYKSPLSLKKSLSFDQQKSFFFNEFKNRKQYTNEFKRKELGRKYEAQDTRMLRNILQYDQKAFVFSLNSDRPSEGLLHHNSRVANFRKTCKIDSQNEKIHFRITKAKSLYSKEHILSSRQSPVARTFLLRMNNSQGKFNPIAKNGAEKTSTESQQQNQQDGGLIKNVTQMQFSKIRRIKDDFRRVQTSQSCASQSKNFKLSRKPPIFAISNNSALCDRVRKERLATKLYEKKIKFQNTIMSRLHRR